MIRAGLAGAPALALVLVVVAWRRTDLILPALAGLACGGLGGVVIGGALGPVRARLSGFKKVLPAGQGSRRFTPRAPVVHGLIGAAIMAVFAFRLQAQGVDKAASLAAAAGSASPPSARFASTAPGSPSSPACPPTCREQSCR